MISRAVAAALVALGLAATISEAGAQLRRPADDRPRLPEFASERDAPRAARVLPPIALPATPGTDAAQAGQRIFIERYAFSGNSVIGSDELASIAAPFAGREVGEHDLARLRDLITRAYVERGYVSSGAIIPPQQVDDGILKIEIVESRLAEIDVSTYGRFEPDYFERRIAARSGEVANVEELEGIVQVLQQDPRVRRINARLGPGATRESSRLDVAVEENPPYVMSIVAANDLSPSVGAEALHVGLSHGNVSGHGDIFDLDLAGSRGFREIEAAYAVPLNVHDTVLRLRGRRSESRIIEKSLRILDIKGRVTDLGVEIEHPIHRDINDRVSVFARGEYRRSESLLLGETFSFSAGPKDGVAAVSVLRLGAAWTHRTRSRVFALRAMVSAGVDVLGATRNAGDTPDTRFLSGLLQMQWAERLQWLRSQIVARAELQLSDDPLLGLEQFALGGQSSLRGYRENALVTDNAMLGSLEWRVPLPNPWPDLGSFTLAPFIDAGNGWNVAGAQPGRHTLVSAGIGALWRRGPLSAEVYWGQPLRTVPTPGQYDLQDDGVSFRLAVVW